MRQRLAERVRECDRLRERKGHPDAHGDGLGAGVALACGGVVVRHQLADGIGHDLRVAAAVGFAAGEHQRARERGRECDGGRRNSERTSVAVAGAVGDALCLCVGVRARFGFGRLVGDGAL